MDHRIKIFLVLIILVQLSVHVTAQTSTSDSIVLNSLTQGWENTPNSWVGSDPCGSNWDGITCNNSRIISITLSSIGLKGQLSGDIGSLSELTTLDLSYNSEMTGPLPASIGNLAKLYNLILVGCSFSGSIPETIGSLQQLVFLSLNSNRFSGKIPASIGKLPKLYWLDLADNQLDGPIPVSSGTTPGLDLLVTAKHFHFGKNQLSGAIPPKLFNPKMILIHVLFESNQLTGSIPTTIASVKSLEVVRFDRNNLNGPVPSNLSSLTNITELFLSNNKLTGPLPNLNGMNQLSSVDMSNNSFDASDIPSWFSTLSSLTTLKMDNTQLQGQVPTSLFGLSNLQTVVLSRNNLNGSLDLGISISNRLGLIDMRKNKITEVNNKGYSSTLILVDNPVCQESEAVETYCTIPPPKSSYYSTPPNNCLPVSCNSHATSSPKCLCAFPYTGTLVFRAPSFSDLGISSYFVSLEKSLIQSFLSNKLPVDSVALSEPFMDSVNYLDIHLSVFPSGDDQFNQTGISRVGFVLSNQTFKPPSSFGPFYFEADAYQYDTVSTGSSKSSNTVIIGAAVGGSLLVVLLVIAALYAFHQKRQAERATELQNPFAQWDATKSSGPVPQLKGARWFSFEELKKCTNNFGDANDVGSGGYGKVYRGTLPSGQLVAIKRAQKESMQGGLEFKTEIELLSRVHHKNLVSLLGFCFEQGEQMLVYEYVANGNLKDSLTGKSGIRLDWMRRLKIAGGAARGLLYLHELADPPIIHRDVKSNNILLDGHLNAKVSDFGLSKLMVDSERDHVTTQVKGTMGYLDPEYYMTQQLTEKSDVYGFGVVMLELITARRPIERGKYIVREVRMAMDKTKDRYNLQEILDPAIKWETLQGIEKFVDLAMRCLEESGAERPTMGEVVKEIESIMVLAGLNPNADSTSTSANYDEASKGNPQNPYGNDDFSYSGAFPPAKVEPQ